MLMSSHLLHNRLAVLVISVLVVIVLLTNSSVQPSGPVIKAMLDAKMVHVAFSKESVLKNLLCVHLINLSFVIRECVPKTKTLAIISMAVMQIIDSGVQMENVFPIKYSALLIV